MEDPRTPHGYSYKGGRDWGRVQFNRIDQNTSVDQMYVARSRRRAPPSALSKTRPGPPSSSLVFSIKACLNDPERQRKRRVAKYNSYTVQGKLKNTLKKGCRWIKRKFQLIVRGD